MQESQLIFSDRLPKSFEFENSILIYDRRLQKKFKSWIKKFPHSYGVSSGEKLKDLKSFSSHVQKILKKTEEIPPRKLIVVALGGGSVGDFAGFFASVFKRGVRLVQIPSTWLAQVDSAHGGKTALNVSSFKNQIGTFYPAEKIYLVRELVMRLEKARFQEACFEALKVALLEGGPLWFKMQKVKKSPDLWRLLPALIRAKLKIVRRDPYEEKGLRHLLNFGHTVGHVIESELGVPHGRAIGYGMRFALEWSRAKGILRKEVETGLPTREELAKVLGKLKNPQKALQQDKKTVGAGLRFIFLRQPGSPVIERVSVSEILIEIGRQKV